MTEGVGDDVGGGGAAVAAHPIADFADRLLTRLDQLGECPVPTSAMTPEQKQHTLRALAVAQARVEAMRFEVLLEADRDDAATDAGDRTAADWVARETRQTRASARGDLRLARRLESDYPIVGGALGRGDVRVDQARAIVRGLDLLPRSGEFAVDADQRQLAESHLVDLAAEHDAKALELLARRVYAVICPGHADAYEGRLLEAEEARAARRVSLEMWDDPQGVVHGKFRVPRLHGEMLRKALQSIMSPARVSTSSTDGGDATVGCGSGEECGSTGAEVSTNSTDGCGSTDGRDSTDRRGSTGGSDTRPAPVRRGEALCELLERMRAGDLPRSGGYDATVVVTMTLEDLLARLDAAGVATLDTGARISAAEARRLACHHRVVPMVLGGRSRVLDQGRARRLHSRDQRLALLVQQGHCTVAHCDAPASMCHVHHDRPWSAGGPTDTTSGRLLCGPHHRRIHDPAYAHRLRPDGTVELHRRT